MRALDKPAVLATTADGQPEPFELPVAVAGVNTAILVSSSFTMHWALEAIRRDNPGDRPRSRTDTYASAITLRPSPTCFSLALVGPG